jgi:hypothetical protein
VLPFASPAWLDALERELETALQHAPPPGDFCFAERYLVDDRTVGGWHVSWSGGEVRFVPEPAEAPQVELAVDLEVAHRCSAPMTAELRELQRAALRDGRIVWTGDATALPAALGVVHERMAELTEPWVPTSPTGPMSAG